MAQINKGGRVAGRATRPEPDSTPRQPVHETVYYKESEEKTGPPMPDDRDDWSPDVAGLWGANEDGTDRARTPEPGNPTADFREGETIQHKPFKIAWEEPFPFAMPYKIKKAISKGGTW